jgi:hypothetical protein
MVDRRKSPDFKQVSGHIPVPIYRKFKSTCAERDISQSEALEKAISIWIAQGDVTEAS